MNKLTIIILFLSFLFASNSIINAENDLPLSDAIKILKVTPYGEETKGIFEIKTDDFSYENFFKLIQDRIKNGYKPDCNCEFDNDYLLSLNNRVLYETDQLSCPWVYFKRKTTWKNYNKWNECFYCVLNLSQNMKYVGIEFLKQDGDYFPAQHFVLLNSRGDKLWELPHKNIEVYTDKEPINFPNDREEIISNSFQVSNNGRVLKFKSDMKALISSNRGWTLYDIEGNIIKDTTKRSSHPVFSNDGNRFLIRENTDHDDDWTNDVFITSCYDETGKLLWRKKQIVPLSDVDFISSTTGKYFMAGFKIGEGNINKCKIDWCIIDMNGNLISRRNYPEKWLDARIGFHGMQLTDDPEIYLMSGIKDENFKTRLCTLDIFRAKRNEYGRIIGKKLLPLNDKYYIVAGYMRSDSKRRFDPYGAHKFFVIIDKKNNLQGLKIIDTGLTNNRTFRLKVDKKALKFYLYANDVSIEAQFDPDEGQNR